MRVQNCFDSGAKIQQFIRIEYLFYIVIKPKKQTVAKRHLDTLIVIGDCMLWAGTCSGLLFCKERLVGQVCGSAMMAWQQWTAAEATVRDTGTQKVERHVGDSSTGPTLRTEKIFK